jgi:hypothetical protein
MNMIEKGGGCAYKKKLEEAVKRNAQKIKITKGVYT